MGRGDAGSNGTYKSERGVGTARGGARRGPGKEEQRKVRGARRRGAGQERKSGWEFVVTSYAKLCKTSSRILTRSSSARETLVYTSECCERVHHGTEGKRAKARRHKNENKTRKHPGLGMNRERSNLPFRINRYKYPSVSVCSDPRCNSTRLHQPKQRPASTLNGCKYRIVTNT